MTRLGYVENGLMVNMIPGNNKLKKKRKILKILNKIRQIKNDPSCDFMWWIRCTFMAKES